MKKNILLGLALFASAVMSFSALAEKERSIIIVEDAIESVSLRIKVSKDLTGVVTGRVCQRCDLKVLKVTPATKMFADGKQIALSRASQYSGKPGTAFFDIKTQLVTKIHSYK